MGTTAEAAGCVWSKPLAQEEVCRLARHFEGIGDGWRDWGHKGREEREG